jgi:hypothetical protein
MHTGNPGDSGVHFGFHFEVVQQALDGSTGTIRVWRQADAAEVGGLLAPAASGTSLDVAARLRNTGGAYTLTLYSDFDETLAGLIAASPISGAVPVAVPPESVVRAVHDDGAAGLAALAVPPGQAVAVAWAGKVGSGADAAFTYGITPRSPAAVMRVTNTAYGAAVPARLLDRAELRRRIGWWLYLPVARMRE